MGRPSKNALPAKLKPPSKQVSQAFVRVLKRSKFLPLEILIKEVFPQLDTEKQADVLLKLIGYMYPKVGVHHKKKGTKIQVNTQVVNQPAPLAAQQVEATAVVPALPGSALTPPSLKDLLQIASQAVEEDEPPSD